VQFIASLANILSMAYPKNRYRNTISHVKFSLSEKYLYFDMIDCVRNIYIIFHFYVI